MELITGIKTRRTVRKFTDKPVSKETINEIISAAAYAPSWKNTQTTRWNIVTDKALIEKIARLYMALPTTMTLSETAAASPFRA